MDIVHSFKKSDIYTGTPYENALLAIQNFISVFHTAFLNQKAAYSCPPMIITKTEHMIKTASKLAAKLKKAYIHSQYAPDNDYLLTIGKCIEELNSAKHTFDFFKVTQPDTSPFTNSIRNNFFRLQASFNSFMNLIKTVIDIEKTNFSYAGDLWQQNHVLVGSLRNSKQLDIAVKHNFYHIPKSLVSCPAQIKCVAIYQSKNLFNNNAGIKYYGKVAGYTETERYRIKEIPGKSDEIYVRFEIDQWKTLKKPLMADYLGDTCIFTTLFQLMQCEKASELLLSTKEEFDLYMFMKRNAFTKNTECFWFMNIEVIHNDSFFEVFKDGKLLLKITDERFFKNGVSTIKAIYSELD